ncbi:gametocyte-specific factor 1 [Drosophila mauritiana]|uniref:Gametocyte-specific factor 1 n=1 Tax=Drosophila mauritiana TaxID=7226 RepID=A0A6P8KWY9_DROMA|nr:gametocyte-specific factor 1 [Drosophila mauritiana]
MSDCEYGICPYDKSHRILLFRMPKHIIKCEKNYRGPPLQTCKYNATHRVLNMEKHLKECDYYLRSIENHAVQIALSSRIPPKLEDGHDVDTYL